MSFSRLHKWVTYLLSGLGLIALTFGGELSPVTMAVIAGLFIASWFAERPLIDKPEYARSWTIMLVGAMGVQLMRGVTGGPVLALAMEFAAMLSISRLFNRRTAADHQQIAVLAFMHLIAATVLTTDLGYAALFVAFVIATPWMLAMTHLRVEIESHYPLQREQSHGVDARRVLDSKRIVGPRFLAWTALLSLPLFVITLGLFLLFPRVGLGLVGLGNARGQQVAGFGNDIELGGFGVIRDDPTVVVRVTPSRDLNPLERDLYLRLRGTAFDRYDGRRWTRSTEAPQPFNSMSDYYGLKRDPVPGQDLELKIVLDRLEEPVLFMPAGTVGFRIPLRGVRRQRARHHVTRGHGLDIRYQSNEELGIVYTAVVGTRPQDRDVPVAEDVSLTRYLQMPQGHGNVIELAQRITSGADNRLQAAQRLMSYLREEGRFRYSLEQPEVPEGKTPLEVFLFDAKYGHCEYYATALAIMLRSIRIPARNVTGFVGGKYNSYGRYYALRQGDAHSWVEALIPGRGWVTFDPTPPAHAVMGPPNTVWTGMQEMLDAVRTYWMTRVIGYDLRTQVTFLKNMRSWFKTGLDFGGKKTTTKDTPDAETRGGGDTLPGVQYVLLLLALLAVGWALWKVRGRSERGPALSQDARRAKHLYEHLERVLARQGHGRPPATTPQAHAQQLKDRDYPAARTVERVTEAYLASRFGGAPLPTDEEKRLRREVDELKRAA